MPMLSPVVNATSENLANSIIRRDSNGGFKAGIVDFTSHEAKNVKFHILSADPSSPSEALYYYNNLTKLVKLYDGTQWISLATIISGKIPASQIQEVIGLVDLTDVSSKTGTGSTVVMANSPVLVTPSIASFTSAQHNHQSASSGGTLLAASITNFDTQVRTNRLDQMAVPTASVNVAGQKIINLNGPTLSSDAASKGYVDFTIGKLEQWKNPVKAVAIDNVQIDSITGTIIDGIDYSDWITGDRFLLTAQNAPQENGIYVVDKSIPSFIRANDLSTATDAKRGLIVWVTSGTTYSNTLWQLTTNDPIILGTTGLTFAQIVFSGGGGGSVDSVNGQTGIVVLTTASINDSTNKRYVSDSEKTLLDANNFALLSVDNIFTGSNTFDGTIYVGLDQFITDANSSTYNIDLTNAQLNDGSGLSIDWTQRKLFIDNTTEVANWSNGTFKVTSLITDPTDVNGRVVTDYITGVSDGSVTGIIIQGIDSTPLDTDCIGINITGGKGGPGSGVDFQAGAGALVALGGGFGGSNFNGGAGGAGGDIYISPGIGGDGDTGGGPGGNTKIFFGRAGSVSGVPTGATGNVLVNEGRLGGKFIIRGAGVTSSDDNFFYVDANTKQIGVKRTPSGFDLDVNGSVRATSFSGNGSAVSNVAITSKANQVSTTAYTDSANVFSLLQTVSFTNTSTSGSQNFLKLTPTYNQASGNAANTDLLINRVETALGSGTQNFLDCQINTASKFAVRNSGKMYSSIPANVSTSVWDIDFSSGGFGSQAVINIVNGSDSGINLAVKSGSTTIAKFLASGSFQVTSLSTVGGLGLGDFFVQRGASNKLSFGAVTDGYLFKFDFGSTSSFSGTDPFILVNPPINTSTSGSVYALKITPTYNQASGSAANTDILVNRTQTALGSGAQLFIDFQIVGVSKAKIDNNGIITADGSGLTNLNASNISSGTVNTARLGTGSADSTTFLRGDQTWAVPAGSGGGNANAFSATFNATTDWGAASGGYYSITFTHGLSFNVTVSVWDETTSKFLAFPEKVELPSSTTIKISVPSSPDRRFAGRIVVVG